MAGEVLRSGLSNPEAANLTAQNPPQPPSDFQVVEVGLQTSNPPNELPRIKFSFVPPSSLKVVVADGANDDIYNVDALIGTLAGTAGTNDLVLTLSAPPSPEPLGGDRLLVGTDPTRYVVDYVDGSDIHLTYGLLQDQPVPGAEVYLLTKVAESPTSSRLITADVADGDEITVSGAYGFDFRLSWTISTELLELEDLDLVGGTLGDASRNYYAEQTGDITTDSIIAGATIIPTLGAPTVEAGDVISFGDDQTITYTVQGTSASAILLVDGLASDITEELSVWVHLDEAFLNYDGLDVGTMSAEKDPAVGQIAGYNLYASDSPTSDVALGDIVMGIGSDDITLESDGTASFYFDAPDSAWNGVRKWFSLTAVDSSVPVNESEPDTSPWADTPPGQASIISSVLVGLDLTITYNNITDGGANPKLYEAMGGTSMGQTSPDGGYDVYLVNYQDATSGTYAGRSTALGRFFSTSFQVGDVVRLVNPTLRRAWVAHCVIAGRVDLTDSQIVTGDPLGVYLGSGAPDTSQFSVSFLRITDRDAQSVVPDVGGEKAYLTDFQNSFVITLNAGEDQGVLIEAVNTLAGYGED